MFHLTEPGRNLFQGHEHSECVSHKACVTPVLNIRVCVWRLAFELGKSFWHGSAVSDRDTGFFVLTDRCTQMSMCVDDYMQVDSRTDVFLWCVGGKHTHTLTHTHLLLTPTHTHTYSPHKDVTRTLRGRYMLLYSLTQVINFNHNMLNANHNLNHNFPSRLASKLNRSTWNIQFIRL